MKRKLPSDFEVDSNPQPARRRLSPVAKQKPPKMDVAASLPEVAVECSADSPAPSVTTQAPSPPPKVAVAISEECSIQKNPSLPDFLPTENGRNVDIVSDEALKLCQCDVLESKLSPNHNDSAAEAIPPNVPISLVPIGPTYCPERDIPVPDIYAKSEIPVSVDSHTGFIAALPQLLDQEEDVSSLGPTKQPSWEHTNSFKKSSETETSRNDPAVHTEVADQDIPRQVRNRVEIAPLDVPAQGQDQHWFTTQVAPVIQPDYDMTDEAYAESATTSYVTSIASEISRGILENERIYPVYGQHSYGMPVDEDEMDRMDLQHRKYELVLSGRHFLAPIGPNPHRILDLGTGTGIWALDVADLYPSASVTGVDIAPIQPKWVATNCQFEIDDVEATWTYRLDSFDFVHFRDPLYCIRDWPKLARQCFDHIKPGGWCELACIYPVVKCDDGTTPDDSGFKVICEKFMEASTIMGAPTDSPIRFAKYLRDAGFVNVSENIFKIPSSPWPKDRRLKQIGALEMTNVVEGAAAFALRAFSLAFGWSKERTELSLVNFKRDVKNRAYHQYCEYYVVYGQKPPDASNLEF